MSLKRQKIIEKYLEKNHIENVEPPYFDKTRPYTYPRETQEGYCIFYDQKTRQCRIHPVKPETCVAGPITFGINLRTKQLEYYLKLGRICPLAGKLNMAEYSKRLDKHLKSAKREIRRLIRNLEPEALQAILEIDEPDTFKIGEEKTTREIKRKLAHA